MVDNSCPRRPGTLFGVGMGPGDPELVTLKALRTIERCAVVAAPWTHDGASLALDIARAVCDLEGKEIVRIRFSMAGEDAEREGRHAAARDILCERLAAGLDVAFLNLGDPSIYATFQRVAGLVRAHGFEARAVPGVPSFCAVAAALDVDLTPQMSAPLHVVPASSPHLSRSLEASGTTVVMKAGAHLGNLKALLADKGRLDEASLVVDAGMPGEMVVAQLADAPEGMSYFSTAVVRP